MADSLDDPELRDLVCLTMVPGVGPRTSRALLDVFGTPTRVLGASNTSLRQVDGVGPKLAERIARARTEHDPEVELALCRQHGVSLLSLERPGYPPPLTTIPDPPPLLYMRGTYQSVDQLAVAIVGSRRATPYGARIAERLAASLARVGLTVVSGLARGIDEAAHRGALKAGGRSIAVLANGLADVYPPEHADLAKQVVASGAIFSEMPMRQQPIAGLFPQRNRIVSGLCLGVVVVEAAPRSGSLVTIQHATEQDRQVFAVPGPVDSLQSRGCHALIRDGAKLVESVEDVLEELAPSIRQARPIESSTSTGPAGAGPPASLNLNETEQLVLDLLDDMPRPADELIARTGLTAAQVLATLSILEMRRQVRRMPGNQFIRA